MVDSSADTTALPNDSRSKPTDLLLIGVFCLTLYLAGNGRISLWDRDEAWYAQATREMVESGDYIAPTFNAQPRYTKPILIYWVMSLGYACFGDNEFGARFFSGVAGAITCLLTYRLGTRMFGRAVGLAAGLMLAVCPLMIVESKLATTDAVLLAVLLGAMSCVWELHTAGFSWRWSLAFWFLIGVAILAKGPVGPAFIVAGVAAWLVLCRRGSVLRRMNWLAGMALAAVVVLPWAVAVYVATDGAFYRKAIGGEVIGHSLSSMEDHSGFPGYYVVMTLVGMFPWTLVLPLAFAGVRRWSRQDGPGSFLLGWMIGPLLMVELMRSKLPHYYLPAYPAWAILMAHGIVEFHRAGDRLAQSTIGQVRIAALGIISIAIAAALAGLSITILPDEMVAPSVTVAFALAGGTGLAVYLFLRRQDRQGWATVVSTWGIVGVVFAAWLLPSAECSRLPRAAARELQARTAEGSAVVLCGFREPSVVFYFGRPIPNLASTAALTQFVRDRGSAVTLLRESDVTKLMEQTTLDVELCREISVRAIHFIRPRPVMLARLSCASVTDKPTVSAVREDGRFER